MSFFFVQKGKHRKEWKGGGNGDKSFGGSEYAYQRKTWRDCLWFVEAGQLLAASSVHVSYQSARVRILAPLPFQFPADEHPGRHQVRTQLLGYLPSMWENLEWVPDFLALAWLISGIVGVWESGPEETRSLCFFQSLYKLNKQTTTTKIKRQWFSTFRKSWKKNGVKRSVLV